jgi:hypothetical protein
MALSTINLTEILENANENPEAVKTVIENRKSVEQRQLEFFIHNPVKGIEITKDDMGESTWYYIKHNGKLISCQFYWNEGSYDSEGNHSLYDEYGFSIK